MVAVAVGTRLELAAMAVVEQVELQLPLVLLARLIRVGVVVVVAQTQI